MNKLYISILILLISFFSFSYKAFAAEVLQVSSSSILMIGDHNRTYTVKIACVDIIPENEEASINWLKKQLPRYTKVNLKPKGSTDGVLTARVISFKNNIDISDKYISNGLAKDKC